MAKGAKFNMLIAAKTAGTAGVKRLGYAMQGVQGKVKGLAASMGLLNKTFVFFAAMTAGAALTGITKRSIDLADSFGKMSDQTGIAANTLMAYVNAGKLAAVSQEEIDKGLRRLSRSMMEADRGTITYKRSFDELGISVRDAEGNFKTTERVFEEIADKFAKMENGARKAALAQEIFGRSGVSLINLLNAGSASLTEFNWQLSEGFAQNAEYFNDQLAVMNIRTKGLGMSLSDRLLPALNSSAEAFGTLIDDTEAWQDFFWLLDGGFRIISAAVFATASMINFMGTAIKDLIHIVGLVVTSGFDDWAKIQEIATEGLSKTWNQAGEDFKNLWKILTEDSNAPESYANHIKGIADELTKTFGGSMKAKLASFGKQMADIGSLAASAVGKAFKGLEDQLVSFVTTGKLEFRKLAQSIISDMVRIMIRAKITLPLMQAFGITGFAKGGAFYNGNQITKFAQGGVIDSPHIFPFKNGIGLAGEAGSEAILPLKRRNGVLGVEGGGSTSVTVNVDASGASQVQGSEDNAKQLGRVISAAIQAELVKQKRVGGILAT